MHALRRSALIGALVASTSSLVHQPRLDHREPGTALAPALEPRVLLPGSSELLVTHFGDDSRELRVLSGGPSDDASEREITRLTRTERRGPSAPRWLATTLRYPTPVDVEDSLLLDLPGLTPRYERFRAGRATMEFRFDRNRVRGTIAEGDSRHSYDRTFRDAVFPVNAVGAVVRSLPLVAGYESVVPVFSAQDTSVVYDTLSVIGAEVYAGPTRRAWYVRAAGPAFVTSYLVDANSRRIVAQELVVRASDTRIRLVPTDHGNDELTRPPAWSLTTR